MKTALRLENLRKDYEVGDEIVHVLKGIDLDVPEGDFLAIMGRQAQGKAPC
jgi:ABC-type lipoprotein export system ATPase subunit